MPATLDRFTTAYLTCAFWSSTNDDGEPLDRDYSPEDLDPETHARMVADCAAFQATYAPWLQPEHCRKPDVDGQAGHDFWLTRNGHGAGFWDGDWTEPAGEALTAAAHAAGEYDLYIGDDGKIHGSGGKPIAAGGK